MPALLAQTRKKPWADGVARLPEKCVQKRESQALTRDLARLAKSFAPLFVSGGIGACHEKGLMAGGEIRQTGHGTLNRATEKEASPKNGPQNTPLYGQRDFIKFTLAALKKQLISRGCLGCEIDHAYAMGLRLVSCEGAVARMLSFDWEACLIGWREMLCCVIDVHAPWKDIDVKLKYFQAVGGLGQNLNAHRKTAGGDTSQTPDEVTHSRDLDVGQVQSIWTKAKKRARMSFS